MTVTQHDLRLAIFGSVLIFTAWYVSGDPVVPVVLAGTPLALCIAIRKPFELCLVFAAFSFFRLHEAFPVLFNLKIPLITAYLSLFTLFWHLFVQRSISPFWPAELNWFMVLFCIATLGIAFALDRPIAISYWTGVLSKIALMTFAIGWLMRGPQEITLATRVIVASGCLIALVAIHNEVFQIDLVGGNRIAIGRELESSIGDPNDLALALLLPLGFAIMLVIERTAIINRLLGLITVPAVLWSIIATQSRGGLIGVIVVFAVIGMRTIKSRLLFWAVAVVAISGLAIVTGISARPALVQLSVGLDDSATDRVYAWRAAINMAIARPLNGVGLSNFSENIYLYIEHWPGFRDMAAHNTWLTVLAETGVPGFVAFVGMIVAMFLSIHRSIDNLTLANAPPTTKAMAVALMASLAGFCASGTFLTQAFTWPVYILLALTVGLGRFARGAADGMSPRPRLHNNIATYDLDHRYKTARK